MVFYGVSPLLGVEGREKGEGKSVRRRMRWNIITIKILKNIIVNKNNNKNKNNSNT
jgi:hypothetical protein